MTTKEEFLPEFSTVTSVTARNAMIDRFEMEIGDFSLVGDEDDICYVLNNLDAFPIQTASGQEVRLFNAANNLRLRSQVRTEFARRGTGAGFYRPFPVVSGILRKSGRRSPSMPRIQGEAVRLSMQVSLNLTRFIQAQKFRRPSRPRNPALSADIVLAIHPRQSWYQNEIVLLPASNVIIGSPHKFGYALRNPTANLFQIYVDEVQTRVSSLLGEQMADRGVHLIEVPYRSLQTMEIYWEFSDNDPIGLVERLTQPLHRLSHHISVTRAIIENFREETTCESRCVTINLTAETRLRVYAKTTRRVRFEVDFSRAAVRQVCGGQTGQTNQQMTEKVQLLIDRAVSEMNWVLSELRREVPTGVPQNTTVGLISKIIKELDDAATSQAVISGLHTFGRIAPEGNPVFLEAAHRLRDAGVLQTLRRQSIYVVTDEYEAALRGLMGLN